MQVGCAGGEADQRRGAHPGGANVRPTDMTGTRRIGDRRDVDRERPLDARNVESQPRISPDPAGAAIGRRVPLSVAVAVGVERVEAPRRIDERPEVAMLAVASAAKRDLLGGQAADRERRDRYDRGVDRLRAERRPFVDAAVRQVAMRAAAERRRVRRQRQPAFQRRAGVTVGAADRQLRFEGLGWIDWSQDGPFQLGGGVGGRGELQDLTVCDRADDALAEDGAATGDGGGVSCWPREPLGQHGAHRRRGVQLGDGAERGR